MAKELQIQYANLENGSEAEPEGGFVRVAGRIAARQYASREGKLFVRVFPDKPISKKPLEQRMGKGKAEPEYWVARVKPGTVVYELAGVPRDIAKKAFVRVAHKLPFKCRFVELNCLFSLTYSWA